MIRRMPPVVLDNVDPFGIVESLDIKDFKPELLVKELKSKNPDVLMMQ